METRQQFISRMLWLIGEIKETEYSQLKVLSLIEFQLKKREADILNVASSENAFKMREESKELIDRKSGLKIALRRLELTTEVNMKSIINNTK